jgi:uncharacterized LabA/DUF88 family protein
LGHRDKLALFIDGASLHYTAKTLGLDVDYKRFWKSFSTAADVLRAFYYTAVNESADYVAVRPLIAWLTYHGYPVRTKPTKELDDGDGRRKFKRAIGVDLAVDALETARHVDRIALWSKLPRRGVHVAVASTLRTKPLMVADELRRQADEFIELHELGSVIGRPLAAAADAQRFNFATHEDG